MRGSVALCRPQAPWWECIQWRGDTLAPVLFLGYIQAVLGTLFPKFEAASAGIEKLMFRSMQPKPAAGDGEMAAGSLMVTPAVFHSSIDLRLHRTWAPISWTARGANKDAGVGQFGGPADGPGRPGRNNGENRSLQPMFTQPIASDAVSSPSLRFQPKSPFPAQVSVDSPRLGR